MHSPLETYRHSGQMGLGAVLGLVAGIVAGAIGSMIYAYLSIYSPIVGVVSALAVVGLGIGVGWVVSWAAKRGHCRSLFVLRFVGFLVGVVTLYLAWVCFEWVLIRQSGEDVGVVGLVGLLASPAAVWGIATEIGQTGWYSIGSSSSTVSGIVLWITWVAEALVLVGAITVTSTSLIDDAVYCEHQRRWIPEWPEPIHLRLPSTPEALEALVGARVETLEAMETALAEESPRLDVMVWATPGDHRTAAFQLRLITTEVNKEGKVETKSDNLTQKVLISTEEVDRLERLAERPPAPLVGGGSGDAVADVDVAAAATAPTTATGATGPGDDTA